MNEQDRESIKDKVMDMVVVGYSTREICQSLNIKQRTAERYIEDRRKDAINDLKKKSEIIIGQMEQDKRKRIKQLWTIALDQQTKKNDRIKAFQCLQAEEDMAIKRAQLAGLLPREAPQIAIQQNITNEASEFTFVDAYEEFIKEEKEKKIEIGGNENGRIEGNDRDKTSA